MIRDLPHRVNYVEKIDDIQTDASEKVSPRSLHLSYEIGALRSQIYMAKTGDITVAPAWKCWGLEEKEENNTCLPLSEYLTN
jgi:hypothetical protein